MELGTGQHSPEGSPTRDMQTDRPPRREEATCTSCSSKFTKDISFDGPEGHCAVCSKLLGQVNL
jgi:hypothetical protein